MAGWLGCCSVHKQVQASSGPSAAGGLTRINLLAGSELADGSPRPALTLAERLLLCLDRQLELPVVVIAPAAKSG